MRASQEEVDLALNGDRFIQPVRKVKKLVQKMPPSKKKTQVEMWPKQFLNVFFKNIWPVFPQNKGICDRLFFSVKIIPIICAKLCQKNMACSWAVFFLPHPSPPLWCGQGGDLSYINLSKFDY